MSLLEAQDPATTPERLRQLFAIKDQPLHASIAENPNTPLDLLLQLIGTHTDSFFRNPALSVLLLENPNLFLELPSQTLRALLCVREPHPWLLSVLESPHEFTEKHGADIVKSLASEAQSGKVFALLISFSDARRDIAANPQTPAEIVEALLLDEDEQVQEQSAKNPRLSVDVLLRLSFSADVQIVSWVASNPSMPVERLEHLLKSPKEKIRDAAKRNLGRLAREATTPFEVLYRLYRGENKSFRNSAYLTLLAVASAPKTPRGYLSLLANDKDSKLRAIAEKALR